MDDQTEPIINQVSIVSMIATAAMAIGAWFITNKISKTVRKTDKFVIFWLIWDAMIHLSLELSFVILSLTTTVEKSTHWTSLVWKEYGKADARWLILDPCIVSLEIITVFVEGPMCLVLVYAIVKNKHYRHFLQVVLCVGEIYGGWMTFVPDILLGSPNLATNNWLYLWVYMVFYNGIWVVIPALLLLQSYYEMKSAFSKKKGQ
ncbi:unnamed protein product [Dimorphilus gyrociliatus]|uniref:EXPERA domain-containing protein n=1 Tax=Dimorphilus gyrociliatus TaxID=2664684 RepID=A0A7I8WA93_9ANNE|nr:unnamed protein product [Dimorphilus gyrociliatus]